MSVIGEQLISIVREKAAESPDYVYEKPLATYPAQGMFDGYQDNACVYVHDGCPSCLIGKALWDAGLIDASLEKTDANFTAMVPNSTISDTVKALNTLEVGEWNWLGHVQTFQDSLKPWGVAVEGADSEAARHKGKS
jgi:hypothetical protein